MMPQMDFSTRINGAPSVPVIEPLEYTGERMVPEKADRQTFWEHIYRYRFATAFVPGKRVLDIACGEGYGSRALWDAGAAYVIGVDISEEACHHATRRYGIDARPGSAEDVPLADGSLDLIVSFETIEHVARPEVFLNEAMRLLVPGGLLVISTPNQPVYDAGVQNPFHCSEMDEAQFVRLLAARFASVDLYSQCLVSAAWWDPRALAAERSGWNDVRGIWRLRSFLCPDLFAGNEADRPAPVEAILRHEGALASWLNPFAVRPRRYWGREVPRYLIAVARKGDRE